MNRGRHMKWPLMASALCFLSGLIILSGMYKELNPIFFLLVLLPAAVGQGLHVPATIVALLASSTRAEQATVTSALVLFRGLGSAFGIGVSSLIVQNGLLHYFNIFITGDRKEDVIKLVRSSVRAIADLEEPYQQQVIQSYESAMQAMFICFTVLAAISIAIIAPVKLSILPSRKP